MLRPTWRQPHRAPWLMLGCPAIKSKKACLSLKTSGKGSPNVKSSNTHILYLYFYWTF